MSGCVTNPFEANKERGSGRAFLSPDDTALSDLDGIDDTKSRAGRLALVLHSTSTDRLKAALLDQLMQLNTDGAMRVSAELTARGIAPCFRGRPVERAFWCPEIDFILALGDMQWIVSTYPAHVPEWARAKAIFDPKRFRKGGEFLFWDGQRTPGQIAKALALTEQQQRECAWIQCLHVERWRSRLFKRWQIAAARVASAVREGDKRPSVDQDVTIKRRSDLWLCAELADWRPQRTATLYAAMTGETLPRNVVAKQLAKLPRVRRTDEVLSN